MKKIGILVLIMLCSVYLAEARSGTGISPGCFPIDSKGKCIYQNVPQNETKEFFLNIYNFDNDIKDFTVSVKSEIDNIEFEPKEFSLQQDKRSKCEDSPGCQTVKVKVNTSNLTFGKYSIAIKASAKVSSGGLLEINQIVGSRILLNIIPKKEELPWKLPEDINNSKGEIVEEDKIQNDSGEQSQSLDSDSNLFKMGGAGIVILILIFLYKKSKKKKKKVYKHKEKKEKETK